MEVYPAKYLALSMCRALWAYPHAWLGGYTRVSLARLKCILVQPGKAPWLGQKHSSCTEILLLNGDTSNFCSFKQTNPTLFIQF